MKILITNDDGFGTQGIQQLFEIASHRAETYMVAPSRNYSGSSSSITLNHDVEIEKLNSNQFILDGTPTDCTRFAYSGLLGFQPDLVLSGINHGANLSDDIIYSGTFGAAREGRFLPMTPVAFSLCGEVSNNWNLSRKVADIIIQFVLEKRTPKNIVLNVNIPSIPMRDFQGIQITSLGKSSGVTRTNLNRKWQNNTKTSLPIPVPPQDRNCQHGSDLYAVSNNFVSVTPVGINDVDFAKFQKQFLNFCENLI